MDVRDLFSAQIQHLAVGVEVFDAPVDRVHQMGFAEANSAVQEDRVERDFFAFCNTTGSCMGEFVWAANNELIECEATV